eukprot:1149367-Pelagomonas_calceolata.AAC.1
MRKRAGSGSQATWFSSKNRGGAAARAAIQEKAPVLQTNIHANTRTLTHPHVHTHTRGHKAGDLSVHTQPTGLRP